jgi:hypothetical protein
MTIIAGLGDGTILDILLATIACMYVDFHIGRIRMDIDNSGLHMGPRQNLQESNVSML